MSSKEVRLNSVIYYGEDARKRKNVLNLYNLGIRKRGSL